jgi:hypothetical protein
MADPAEKESAVRRRSHVVNTAAKPQLEFAVKGGVMAHGNATERTHATLGGRVTTRSARGTAAAALLLASLAVLFALPMSAAHASDAMACSLKGQLTANDNGYPGTYAWAIALSGTCIGADGHVYGANAAGQQASLGRYGGFPQHPDGLCQVVGHFVGNIPNLVVGLSLTDQTTGQQATSEQFWSLPASGTGIVQTPLDNGVLPESVTPMTIWTHTVDYQGVDRPGQPLGAGALGTRLFGDCANGSPGAAVEMTFVPLLTSLPA